MSFQRLECPTPTDFPLQVVLKTFLKHTKRKGVKAKDGDKTVCAVDDIYYDE